LSSYLESSFLLSLYIADANSRPAATRIRQIDLPAITSSLTEVELVNALQLRVFRKDLTTSQATSAYEAFRIDVREGAITILPLNDSALTLAKRIAMRWTPRLGIRSLDLIHVAAAVDLSADSFETFDNRQKRLAQAVGLKVA
jgi:predicted nucleic acid-binding protein